MRRKHNTAIPELPSSTSVAPPSGSHLCISGRNPGCCAAWRHWTIEGDYQDKRIMGWGHQASAFSGWRLAVSQWYSYAYSFKTHPPHSGWVPPSIFNRLINGASNVSPEMALRPTRKSRRSLYRWDETMNVPPPPPDREARKPWPVGHAQVAGAVLQRAFISPCISCSQCIHYNTIQYIEGHV